MTTESGAASDPLRELRHEVKNVKAAQGAQTTLMEKLAGGGPSPWLGVALTAAGLLAGMVIGAKQLGQDAGALSADVRTLSAQVAETRAKVELVPGLLAAVQRLEAQAGQAGQAREAARQDVDRVTTDLRQLERQIGELKGRQDATGTAMVTLQGTSTVLAALKAEVDGLRRETDARDRAQDERLRSHADLISGLRDGLVSRGFAPPQPRRQEGEAPPLPPDGTIEARLPPAPRLVNWIRLTPPRRS